MAFPVSMRFVRALVGLNPCAAGHDLREQKIGQWECARCGYRGSSERGPEYAEQPYFLVSPTAQGPNCGWVSEEQEQDRQQLFAEREAEAAKWRTRQGHDIELMDDHWARVQLCRGWPDSRPGAEPIYVWTCQHCGADMRIQIFRPDSPWILSIIAQRIHEADPEHFLKPIVLSPGLVHAPTDGVDGCLYVDVQCVWHPDFRQLYPGATHVGFFTHVHADDPATLKPYYWRLDGIVHMASRYEAMFVREKLYPAERMIVLRPGEVADQFPLKKIRIGVCQRGGHVGKGSEFLPMVIKALDQEIRDGLELHFCGQNWAPPNTQLTGMFNYHGVFPSFEIVEDMYASLYGTIDYLLIPSLWEGGPCALLEALACGLPVIAAEVGWVTDFAAEAAVGDLTTFVPGDVEALKRLLTGLVAPRLRRRRLVEGMSYGRYAADLLGFFEKVRGMK